MTEKKTLNIGIDFHAAERNGTGNCTYIRNVVENIIDIAQKNRYYLYITDISNDYYKIFNNKKNVFIREIKARNPVIRFLKLGMLSHRDNLDILHCTYYAPPFYKGKLVLTIHDISYLYIPECFSLSEKIKNKLFIPYFAKKANKITTCSIHSKHNIVEKFQLNPDKIEVQYYGFNAIFKPVKNKTESFNILRQFGIKNNFILFVGRINKRKNIFSLIKAFEIIKKNNKIHHQLVIVGKMDFLTQDEKDFFNNMQNKQDIIFTGFVEDKYLPDFYNCADVFVYPSLYEGFGLPVVEAMACGCPVITTNVTSIPEVAGDAAILINPDDEEAIVNALRTVIFEEKLKQELVEKGLIRSKIFSWRNSAKAMLEVLEGV